ncbi:MAG: hypothetical protein R3304_11870, partial [Longimicrobiales bacterium]|nr:hypothetical protein [Longimicrobiales bacterium]
APFLAVLLLPALTGCAARTTGAAALPDAELAGHLLTSGSGNWFLPCEAGTDDAPLWVTFTGLSVRQIEEARASGMALAGDTVFVRWRAALTDERMVGPGGPALLVRDIAVIRPAADGPCPGR